MKIELTNLRCEYHNDPIAIDIASPRLSWMISADYPVIQKTFRIMVSESKESLESNIAEKWDTGVVESSDCNQISYDGVKLEPFREYYWKVGVQPLNSEQWIWSNTASWGMGFLDSNEWRGKWLSYPVDSVRDVRYFRKNFATAKKVKRAIAYATSCGIFELHVNGNKVEDEYFMPGWTDYSKRHYYRGYDITSLLLDGDNSIGMLLAEGWYKGNIGYGGHMAIYGFRISVLLNLRIEYQDGSCDWICTDPKWKTSLGGIQEASFLMGEKSDTRYEPLNWSKPYFDDSKWQYPIASELTNDEYWDNAKSAMTSINAKLLSYPGTPVKAYHTLSAQQWWETQSGSYVFDLGQNFAGIINVTFNGEVGTIVRLRYAEVLNPDKSIYVENLRSAISVDEITLRGGEQTWQPKFTFHGFRYVEITGIKREQILSVSGIALSSINKQTGRIKTSNSLINRLFSNVYWTQQSNFIDIPTDCPQRDERLGWTGDAQVFIKTAAYNADVAAFFTKWLDDLSDTQNKDGAVSNVAPTIPVISEADAAWGDAAIICPWQIYRFYGDKRILAKHYSMMKNWIKYLQSTSDNYIRNQTFCFGDWLSIDSYTPSDFIQTAFFAYSTGLIVKVADVLGNTEDATEYQSMYQNIKEAFINKYINEDGSIEADTQTAYVLALHFNLYPEHLKSKLAENLKRCINKADNHLSTGFVGTPYLLHVLSDNGLHELAGEILLKETYPSWGYSIKNGATTIWERWNGWTEKEGCADANMNSYSHYAYGSVIEWLYAELAGIKPATAGFETIELSPKLINGIDWIEAEFETMRGTVSSSWQRENDSIKFKFSIPSNTKGIISLPTMEGYQPIPTEGTNSNSIECAPGEHEFIMKKTLA